MSQSRGWLLTSGPRDPPKALQSPAEAVVTESPKLSGSEPKYCRAALEARSRRARCWQGGLLLRAGKKSLIQAFPLHAAGLLVACGVPRLVEVSPESLPPSSHGVLPVYLCPNFLFT